MPEKQRAGREEDDGEKSRQRSAEAPGEAPDHREPKHADQPAGQPPCLEHVQWEEFREQGGSHVETAAIHVKIDERQCPLIGEAGGIEGQQQLAVLRMGEVVPAEAVVAEGQRHRGRDERIGPGWHHRRRAWRASRLCGGRKSPAAGSVQPRSADYGAIPQPPSPIWERRHKRVCRAVRPPSRPCSSPRRTFRRRGPSSPGGP